MFIDPLDREILKYEKQGFKVTQKRKLKYGLRIYLKKESEGFLSSGFFAVYIYYVDGSCTIESLRECFRDYATFFEEEEFDEDDKGIYLCRGVLDESLFRDVRKAVISDNDIRKSIKLFSLGESLREPSKEIFKGEIPREISKGEASRERNPKKVFIVHGRDKIPALELARFVEKRYPIEAILLEEQAHRGRTLIEKLEDYSNVDFAFITLTPDDIGALKGEKPTERGRQNVLFEWGQFIGKIGRKYVCLLIKGDVEIPSDLHGIGYYRFNKDVKECFIDVENELKDSKLI